MRIIVLAFLGLILTSLFSGLYFLLKDRGRSERMARALTVRITLSIVLFALLIIAFQLGFVTQRL
jgi:hypothetical protein